MENQELLQAFKAILDDSLQPIKQDIRVVNNSILISLGQWPGLFLLFPIDSVPWHGGRSVRQSDQVIGCNIIYLT